MSATQPSQDKQAGIGCGPLAKYPILSVVGFAVVGIALGIGLGAWEPDNADVKMNVLKWIGLLGDLFIRALKAVILPLVFVNVAVSVVDMMLVGRASSVGGSAIILYTVTREIHPRGAIPLGTRWKTRMTNGIPLRYPPTERIILMTLHLLLQSHQNHNHHPHNNDKTEEAKVLLVLLGQPFKNGCLQDPEMWLSSNGPPGLITDPW
jgi:hypothetical protein